LHLLPFCREKPLPLELRLTSLRDEVGLFGQELPLTSPYRVHHGARFGELRLELTLHVRADVRLHPCAEGVAKRKFVATARTGHEVAHRLLPALPVDARDPALLTTPW